MTPTITSGTGASRIDDKTRVPARQPRNQHVRSNVSATGRSSWHGVIPVAGAILAVAMLLGSIPAMARVSTSTVAPGPLPAPAPAALTR